MKANPDPPDSVLLEQFRAGEILAFDSLVERWQTPLLRFAFSFQKERMAAEDAVQETFLRFLRAEPVCGKAGSLGPWFFQVCRNYCLDAIKKENREMDRSENAAPQASPPTPVELLEGAEIQSLVNQEIGQLPVKEREVLQLKVQEGLTYQEIGEVLGIAKGTVGWLAHQAMGRLSFRLSRVAATG